MEIISAATEKGKLTMGKRLIDVGKRLIDARQIEEHAKNMENLAFKKVCYTQANSPFYPIYSEQFSEITQFRKLILNAQTVDAVPVVHARWLVKGQDIYCSYCDGESGYTAFGGSAFSKFCPNCGAKMDGEDE